MCVPDSPDDEKSGLVFGTRRDFDQIRIQPQKLGIHEVDPVLLSIYLALGAIELEGSGWQKVLLFPRTPRELQ